MLQPGVEPEHDHAFIRTGPTQCGRPDLDEVHERLEELRSHARTALDDVLARELD